MSQKPILFGAAGIVLGFLGGIAIGSATNGSKIGDAVSQAMAPAQESAASAATAQQEALAGLSDRIAALEAAMSESSGSGAEMSAALSDRLESMHSDMQSRLDEVAAGAEAQARAMQSALADLSGGMQEAAQLAAAAVASKSGGGAGASAEGMTITDPLGVGETALFADGDVRAFVSRLDPQGGAVRLMVNRQMAALGAGGSTQVSMDGGTCTVAVMGLENGRVTLGSDCGSTGAAGEEMQGDGDSAASGSAPSAEAPEDGVRAGEVARLADGQLRVFVSGLASDGSGARIAVNGVRTQMVGTGESIDVTAGDAACTVTVTGVGNGMVGLEGSCG